MTSNKDHPDSNAASAQGHASSAHSADAIATLFRSGPQSSAPHIGDALVLSGLSGLAAIDGISLVIAALENMPAEPNDLNQAKLGLRMLASADKDQVPGFAESKNLAKLALEIINTADLAQHNQDKVRRIAFRVYDLIRMLVETSKMGNMPEFQASIVDLEHDLSKILDIVKSVALDKTILHLIHSHSIGHQLAKCDTIVDGYVDKIKASISVQKQQMLIRQEAKLADLTVTKANISDSLKDQDLLLSAKSSARLPPPPAHFVGRDDLVQQGIEHILLTPVARVIILGLGGIGKTSLALAIAHNDRIKEIFGNKSYFVSCEGLKSGLDLVLSQ
ncbi:hypothetical protein CVT25_015455 [Psilocybe cyanescens]|uniref:NB-ARC domain-containing protein n=1 Tax=Psilocybe cyanescens TaxID=93625 RepID=A0A409WHH0_PSICY|nr:hypothetical protein CVT25_015455 [Psilocybe cyanescens]